MSKEVSFKNRDRFVQLGIAIAALRKMRGLSQEKLAEKAVSAAHSSARLKRRTWLTASRWMCSSILPMRWRSIPLTLSTLPYSRTGS